MASRIALNVAGKIVKGVGETIYTEKGKEAIIDATKKGKKFLEENKENFQNASNSVMQPLSIETYGKYEPYVNPKTPPKYIGGIRRKTRVNKRRKTRTNKRRTMRRKKW